MIPSKSPLEYIRRGTCLGLTLLFASQHTVDDHSVCDRRTWLRDFPYQPPSHIFAILSATW